MAGDGWRDVDNVVGIFVGARGLESLTESSHPQLTDTFQSRSTECG